jgi:hypothetical protein
MTTDQDSRSRIVLSWLREDLNEDAERVLLLALDEVDATPQRRSWWPARRSTQMNRFLIGATAVAAVLLAAIVAFDLLAGPTVGRPDPTPTQAPSVTPTPTATPSRRPDPTGPPLLTNGPLAAGSYRLLPFSSPNASLTFTITVPSGWHGNPGAVTPEAGPGAPDGGAVAFLLVTDLYRDPCRADTGGALISAGETVDDLVRAFGEVESTYEVGTAVDVTVDGYSGRRIDLVVPSDVDFASCERGEYWIWEPGPWAQGPGNRWNVWILDVEGTRLVILGHDFPGTPPAVQAELQGIVSSVLIDP